MGGNNHERDRSQDKLTRRQVLKMGGGVLAASLVMVACGSANVSDKTGAGQTGTATSGAGSNSAPTTGTGSAASTKPPSKKNFKGTLRVEPGSVYFPAPPSESNPNPPTIMKTLADEYEKKHPGVKIELVQIPNSTSSDTWRVTSFQGGTEPHILTNNYIRVWQEQINGWYIPLNDYLKQPNPYVPKGQPGSEHWKDEIPDKVWDTTLYSNGNQYLVTTEGVVAAMLYNKEILDKVGIPTENKTPVSIWSDWQDMLDSMKKLKDAGYQALGVSMSQDAYSYNWIDGVTLTSVFYDNLSKMGEPKELADSPKWHAMSQEEVCCGVQNDLFSAKDPRFGDFVDIMKEFQQYWSSGYTTLSGDEINRLFITQKVPLVMAIVTNPDIRQAAKFKYSPTALPPLTKDTSKYAANVHTSFGTGGYTSGYTITERAKKEDKLDLAVDFLQYLSAQPEWSRVVKDAPIYVPTPKGLSIPEVIQDAVPLLKVPIRAFKDPDPRISKKYGVEHRRLMQQFFTGQIDKKQLIDSEDQLMTSQAEATIKENQFSCKTKT